MMNFVRRSDISYLEKLQKLGLSDVNKTLKDTKKISGQQNLEFGPKLLSAEILSDCLDTPCSLIKKTSVRKKVSSKGQVIRA